MEEFLTWVILLLGFLVALAPCVLISIGMGLVAYYVFRGRVFRRALRALVVKIPLADVLGFYLVVGFGVLYIQIISQ